MNILITRLSHIGDCVLTMPLAMAIKRARPDARIIWAVEKPSDKLLANHEAIDQVLVIPGKWLKRARTVLELRTALRSLRVDVAIDPQSITKSAALAWLSAAPVRIGFSGRWGRELAPWLNNHCVRPKNTHLVDRTMELLQPIGIDQYQVEFGLKPTEQADRSIVRFLEAEPRLDRFAVINPGASWPSKRWVTERFGEVANALKKVHGLNTVVTWAGAAERRDAVTIFRHAPDAVTLAPQTNLVELTALLQRAELFIGCDTGPMHMAAAVGTPCVVLYGPTLPQESGAWGAFHQHVQKWYQAGSCRARRRAENLAMRDIQPADVIAACEKCLSNVTPDKFAA